MSVNEPLIASQVIDAERSWLAAHLRLDMALLATLMANEYHQVSSSGQLLSRSQVLESLASGLRHWHRAESDEYVVKVYGATAVVTGRWRAKGVNAGQPFDYSARYVAVWVHRDGRLQMVSDQSTDIPGVLSGL
jgi:ketosteroid isomerase-like protein